MSFEGHFPIGGIIPKRAEAEPVFDSKERDDRLDALDTATDDIDTAREERIGQTKDMMVEIRKGMADRHEFTVEAKLEMLENIAELGVESVLAEIVAERYGFSSFKAAMNEFGVYTNGATVYGDIVDKGEPESNIKRIVKKGFSDFKKSATSGVIGGGGAALALSGLAALGLVAAPSLLAIGIGVAGSVVGSTIAKGVARHWTRRSLFEKQAPAPLAAGAEGPPPPPAEVPEGMEWQGSIAQRAAEDMVSFIKEAQLLAKQASKFVDKQAAIMQKDNKGKDTKDPVYTKEEIQTYKLQQLNKILRCLDTNGGPNGEQNIFGNVAAYQQGVKKAEKKERWAGFAGGILGGAGFEALSHAYQLSNVAHSGIEHLQNHGMWMQNGHPSAEHVGHFVKEVNGAYHFQVDPSAYTPPTPDAGTAHGILNQQDLQPGSPAMAFVETHLRHAHQTFFGNHIPFNTMAHEQLMHQVTEGVTTSGAHQHGFSLTQETLNIAKAGNLNVYHAGTLERAAVEGSLLNNLVVEQFAQYVAIVGSTALAEPIGEAAVAGRERGIRNKIRKEGMELVRMSFTSDIPEPTPPPPPAPAVAGPDGVPVPSAEAVAEPASAETKTLEQVEAENKKYAEFEEKFMKKNDGTENFSDLGKQVESVSTSYKERPPDPKAYLTALEGSVDTYDELKDALIEKAKVHKAASPFVRNYAIMMPIKYIERILATLGRGKTVNDLQKDLVAALDAARLAGTEPGFNKSRDQIAIIATANANKAANNFPAWREHLEARAVKTTDNGNPLEFSSEKLV